MFVYMHETFLDMASVVENDEKKSGISMAIFWVEKILSLLLGFNHRTAQVYSNSFK